VQAGKIAPSSASVKCGEDVSDFDAEMKHLALKVAQVPKFQTSSIVNVEIFTLCCSMVHIFPVNLYTSARVEIPGMFGTLFEAATAEDTTL